MPTKQEIWRPISLPVTSETHKLIFRITSQTRSTGHASSRLFRGGTTETGLARAAEIEPTLALVFETVLPVVRRDLCGGGKVADLHLMAPKSDASVPW